MPDALEFILYLAASSASCSRPSASAPLGRLHQPDRPGPRLLGLHPPGGRPQTGELTRREPGAPATGVI